MSKLIIFDFDGTLADTLPIAYRIFNNIFFEEGKTELKDYSTWSLLKRLKVRFYQSPWLLYIYRRELAKTITTINPIANIKEILKKLYHQDFYLAIVSSNSLGNIFRFLDQHQLHYFKNVEGNFALFSKHRAVKKLLKKHNYLLEDCYYVGDEVRDIECAKRAGIKSVAVSWGGHSYSILAKANPDYIAKKPEDLWDYFCIQ